MKLKKIFLASLLLAANVVQFCFPMDKYIVLKVDEVCPSAIKKPTSYLFKGKKQDICKSVAEKYGQEIYQSQDQGSLQKLLSTFDDSEDINLSLQRQPQEIFDPQKYNPNFSLSLTQKINPQNYPDDKPTEEHESMFTEMKTIMGIDSDICIKLENKQLTSGQYYSLEYGAGIILNNQVQQVQHFNIIKIDGQQCSQYLSIEEVKLTMGLMLAKVLKTYPIDEQKYLGDLKQVVSTVTQELSEKNRPSTDEELTEIYLTVAKKLNCAKVAYLLFKKLNDNKPEEHKRLIQKSKELAVQQAQEQEVESLSSKMSNLSHETKH